MLNENSGSFMKLSQYSRVDSNQKKAIYPNALNELRSIKIRVKIGQIELEFEIIF